MYKNLLIFPVIHPDNIAERLIDTEYEHELDEEEADEYNQEIPDNAKLAFNLTITKLEAWMESDEYKYLIWENSKRIRNAIIPDHFSLAESDGWLRVTWYANDNVFCYVWYTNDPWLCHELRFHTDTPIDKFLLCIYQSVGEKKAYYQMEYGGEKFYS